MGMGLSTALIHQPLSRGDIGHMGVMAVIHNPLIRGDIGHMGVYGTDARPGEILGIWWYTALIHQPLTWGDIGHGGIRHYSIIR